MARLLNWLFALEPGCGLLCRDVEDEIQAMRLAERIRAAAREQHRRLP